MDSIRRSNHKRLPWSCVVLAGAGLTGGVSAQAQGCIAVRGGGMCPDALSLTDPSLHTHAGAWQVGLGYRWLHSFRHFAGGETLENERHLYSRAPESHPTGSPCDVLL